MTGSKMTTMTLDEMRAARGHGESLTDWELVRHEAREGIEPEQDEDSPDASGLMRAEIKKRRRGRPIGTTKVSTTVRLDRDILDAFRATGPGWQSRMNQVLKEWIKAHPPA